MFSNMIMLAGLGGAVIPLVLHLLARARHRTVDWGAMMFLQGRDFRHSQSTRLRQWALLAVRMLTVALLAMALARPVVRGKWSGMVHPGRITAVIVLDCSSSMAYEEVGRTRFDKAREAVLQILASLRKGDEVSFVLLGDQLDTLYRDPTTNLQLAARDIAELRVSNGMADFDRGLAVAKTILDQPSRINRELYLVCDRQAANWRALESNSGAAFRKWLAQPNNPTRFYVIPVGGTDSDNVAIESVSLVDALAVRDQPAEVEVRVRNYGSMPCTNAELTLSAIAPSDTPVDGKIVGRVLKTSSVSVGPGSEIAIRVLPERPAGLFKEYWHAPGATESRMMGPWYLTGDRAYFDDDGYLWFVGRADDVIISSGYRIGPFEVESALIEHPAVQEAAVVASPDPMRGEVVKAYVILAPGYSPSHELAKELQEFVKSITAPYKYPREIEFVPELPKTISGKIRRVELRELERRRKLESAGA
jgi:acyl-CoA synthetase (AMP-forming)/AMP-acid ligase II